MPALQTITLGSHSIDAVCEQAVLLLWSTELAVPALQIISLGSHSIDADFEQAVLLMEVMPSLLAKRNFDPLNTLLQLEPGYRDSPEPNDNMAIVFVKVHFWPSCLLSKAKCAYACVNR